MDYDEPQFFRIMQYAAAADRDVIDMVSGNPDWPPPAPLREGLRAYADADPDRFQYPPSEGIERLVGEVADRRGVTPESVVLTHGTGEANYLALAAALERSAGDEVVCVDPVYPYYPAKVALLGGTLRRVPAGPTGALDPAAVREATGPETAAILVNTPNNPTGAVYDADTMAALGTIAGDADALLISDEVYDRFDYTGSFASARALESPHAVVTGGYSKALAITGLRVGYAIADPAVVGPMRTRHMLVTVTGSRPAQAAVHRALRETPPAYYERNRERLRERIDTVVEGLAGVAEVTRPDGGFYVLVRLPGVPGTRAGVERLIDEAGVAGMPGRTFGTTCDDWIRLALVTPRVEEAVERLRAHCG